MDINDYNLRITGIASIGAQLEPDKRVKISTELEIDAVTKKDNKDGTFDLQYKAHISSHIDFEQEGKVWRGKNTQSESKKLRSAIYMLQNEKEQMGKDSELFYSEMMRSIRSNLGMIYELTKGKL